MSSHREEDVTRAEGQAPMGREPSSLRRDEYVTSGEMRDDRAYHAQNQDVVTGNYTTAPPATGTMRRYDAAQTHEVEIPEAYNFSRDRVRWGPIVAGYLAALTSLLILSLLGLAIGLSATDAGGAGGATAPEGANEWGPAIWGGISAILAFLIGGLVAGRTAAVFDRGWGALNGAMVFLLAVPVTLWFAGMGLGTVFGQLGAFAAELNVEAGQAVETARNAAWGTLFAVLLGLGAAALGGALGTRRDLGVDRRNARVSD